MTQPITSVIQRLATSPVYLTLVRLELLGQLGVLHPHRGERLRLLAADRFERAVHAFRPTA